MITETIAVEMEKPFGNLYRKATVLIAVKDDNGKFVFGCKQGYYPEGITRLPGGGVNEGEDPAAASVRELKEELGVDATTSDLKLLGNVRTVATTPDREYETITYLYYFELKNKVITAGDDVTHFVFLDFKGVDELVLNYERIPENLMQIADGEDFSWHDYGKVYGPLHKMVFNEIRKM